MERVEPINQLDYRRQLGITYPNIALDAEFQETLSLAAPPKDWPEALKAMWFDATGDWESSHNVAQEMHNELGSWLHAYLHRKEGDRFNAGYWYRQAGKTYPSKSLDAELQEIVEFILEENGGRN